MYPFASLPENMAAFCRRLRDQHGFIVGPRELQDAHHALELVALGDERAVRDVLRPILSATRDDEIVFDGAFQAFFLLPTGRSLPDEAVSMRRLWDSDATARKSNGTRTDPEPAHGQKARHGSAHVQSVVEGVDDDDTDPGNSAAQIRSRLSPFSGEGDTLELAPVDDAWREAAQAFVRRMRTGRARAWRATRRGPRFDFRRTLRSSLQTGGEVLATRWLQRPRRRPRFVLFVDGSRSMRPAVQAGLQLAVALATATANLEVFAFSTNLSRITPDVRRAAAGERRQVSALQGAWGGGTSIGASLLAFHRGFGERFVSRHTIVLVASDGLDAGDPAVLREVMARLHRQTASVIWLNPLIGTPGFEPTATGIRVIQPYVTTFGRVDDAAGLARLTHSSSPAPIPP